MGNQRDIFRKLMRYVTTPEFQRRVFARAVDSNMGNPLVIIAVAKGMIADPAVNIPSEKRAAETTILVAKRMGVIVDPEEPPIQRVLSNRPPLAESIQQSAGGLDACQNKTNVSQGNSWSFGTPVEQFSGLLHYTRTLNKHYRDLASLELLACNDAERHVVAALLVLKDKHSLPKDKLNAGKILSIAHDIPFLIDRTLQILQELVKRSQDVAS